MKINTDGKKAPEGAFIFNTMFRILTLVTGNYEYHGKL